MEITQISACILEYPSMLIDCFVALFPYYVVQVCLFVCQSFIILYNLTMQIGRGKQTGQVAVRAVQIHCGFCIAPAGVSF